jgi:3-deoxy-7-phosphoheptulonate synthase
MENVANQILEGNQSIIGLMVESHLNWGCQAIPKDLVRSAIRRIDHRCLHRLVRTENTLRSMHAKLKDVLPKRKRG